MTLDDRIVWGWERIFEHRVFIFPMGAFVFLVLAAMAVAPPQDEAERAEGLLKQACEVVWESGTAYQIDRCTARAMAAMGDENRLRDNELKRLLIACEHDLEKAKSALSELGNVTIKDLKEGDRLVCGPGFRECWNE